MYTISGEGLKKLREDNNLTQKQMGEIGGVVKNSIAKYESEFMPPSVKVLLRFSDHFNVHLELAPNSGYSKKPPIN